MKLLPCAPLPVSGRAGCRGPATLPDGKPYVIGMTPESLHRKGGFIYRCFGCKLNSHMDSAQWHRLPELTLADLRRLGLAEMAETDLLGAGVTPEQIEALAAAGFDSADFAKLHREAPAPALEPKH